MQWKKILSNKKYLAFFATVPVLVAVSLVQVTCPICQGSGVVSILPGMENIHIMQVDGEQRVAVQNICEMYTLFQYDVTVRLTNSSYEDVDGWLKLVLRDYSKGTMLDRQYVAVSIPALSTVDASFKAWFRTGVDVPATIEVHAEPVIDNIADDACNGTGKLPLNLWLVVNSLKGSLQEVAREDQEFNPPAPFYPAEGGSWAE
jgi:hypothetical protein